MSDQGMNCTSIDDQVGISLFTLHTGQQSVRELSCENVKFVWAHLLIDVLIKMSPIEKTMEEMLKECRQFYINDSIELRKIDDFAMNYPKSKLTALQWYTCDSFLYRLFNKAFRTENIDILFKFRFFIHELYQELMIEHEKYLRVLINNPNESILTVFRGQTMSKQDFDKIKRNENGGLIAFNGFLSTSKNCAVAAEFGGVHDLPNPDEVHVLFEIDIDIQQNATADQTIQRPFTEIVDSTKEGENEVLLSIGTIFQIGSIEEYDTMYYVRLKMQQEENKEIIELISYLKRDISEDSLLLTFGDFLYDMGEFNKAEYYYNMLLNELPDDHIDIGKIYNNLGLIYYERDKYIEAALAYGKAFDTFVEKDIEQYFLIVWSNFVDLLCSMNMESDILEQRVMGLVASESIIPCDKARLASCYDKIGLALDSAGRYDDALLYFKRALSIKEQYLPHLHSYIPCTHQYIALTYQKKGYIEEARNYIEKALKLQLKALPNDHPRLGALYSARASIHHDSGRLEKALDDYERALSIYRNMPLKLNLATVYNNLGHVWIDKGNYEISLIMYQKAYAIICDHGSTQPKCKAMHATILANISQICSKYEQKNADLALHLVNKSLEITLEYLPPNHCDLAKNYIQIASIWHNKENCDMALKFYQRALDIQLNSEVCEHSDISCIYSNMAVIYENKGQLEQALSMYKKAIDLFEKKSLIHSDVAMVNLNISGLCETLNRIDEAIYHAKQAVNIAEQTLQDDHPTTIACKKWLAYISKFNVNDIVSKTNE
ncbi:hypothetical protein I4U23_022780 [Adineta vaga]|nr:hypothetical protein I4U23_022780 [Adineta vaga]